MKFFNFSKEILFLKYLTKNRIIMKMLIISNFKRAIKSNIDYIQITNPTVGQENYFRAVGKTTSLINLANKYNLPIYFKNFSTMMHIKTICEELELKVPNIYRINFEDAHGEHVRGLKMILIDEDVTVDDVKILQSQNPIMKVVGFARINFDKKN